MTSSTCGMSRPARCAKGDGFGEALHQACDADLIDRLGQLARPAVAQQRERLCENAMPTGLHGVEGRRLAATHDGQHAILCTRLTAGHRRIHKCKPAALACASSSPRQLPPTRWCGRQRQRQASCRRRRHRPPASRCAGRRRRRHSKTQYRRPAQPARGVGACRCGPRASRRNTLRTKLRTWLRCGCTP